MCPNKDVQAQGGQIVAVWLWAVFELACDFSYSDLTRTIFAFQTSTSCKVSAQLTKTNISVAAKQPEINDNISI